MGEILTRERGSGAGGGVGNPETPMEVWLLPAKERGKEGGMGMKSLKVQLSSRKVSADPWGVLRPKSLIRGVLHLATMCLQCKVLGWEQPVPGSGPGCVSRRLLSVTFLQQEM